MKQTFFLILLLHFTLINCASAQNYCIPNSSALGGTQAGDFIDEVILNGGINISGASSYPNYNDFGNLLGAFPLYEGNGYWLTIKAGTYFPEKYAVWMDFNGDGDFDDLGEELMQQSTTSAYEILGVSFTVPTNLQYDNVFKMRVRCTDTTTALSPCVNYVFGETEDYDIIISDSPYCIPSSVNTSLGSLINEISLNSNISNNVSYSDYDYFYEQDPFTYLYTNTLYNLGIQSGQLAGYYYAAWIDYNGDNDFDDLGEKLGEIQINNFFQYNNISFTVPNVVNQTAVLNFRMRIRCSVSPNINPCVDYANGETEDYALQILPGGYCQPAYTNGTINGDFISNIALLGTENPTSFSNSPFFDEFLDFNTIYFELYSNGGNYNLNITSGSQANNYVAAWIDFNGDSDFNDVGEKIGEVFIGGSFTTVTLPFITPNQANDFLFTRMRIRCSNNQPNITPCGQYNFGETEDYFIGILKSNVCVPYFTFGTDNGDNISNVNLGVLSNSTSTINNYPPFYYQQYSFDENSNTLPIPNIQINSNYSVNVTGGSFFDTSGNNDTYAVWIDYNHDGDFVDVGEKLAEFEMNSIAFQNFSFPFIVPLGAAIGQTTMRVRCARNISGVEPCLDYTYGETEDYFVNITDFTRIGSTIVDLPSLIDCYPNPFNDNLTIIFNDQLSQKCIISIYNSLGEKVYGDELLYKMPSKNIDTRSLPSGIYYLTIQNDNNKIITNQLLKIN